MQFRECYFEQHEAIWWSIMYLGLFCIEQHNTIDIFKVFGWIRCALLLKFSVHTTLHLTTTFLFRNYHKGNILSKRHISCQLSCARILRCSFKPLKQEKNLPCLAGAESDLYHSVIDSTWNHLKNCHKYFHVLAHITDDYFFYVAMLEG